MSRLPSRLLLACALGALLPSRAAPAAVRVVTTTPTFADITRQIGGDHVEVESLMRGPENPHNVIPRPGFIVKLRQADLFVHAGLDLESWVPQLVKGAREQKLLYGEPGNVDVSQGIPLLEVPMQGELTRALGDIHVYGNPHYMLEPANGIIVARTITAALQRTDPAHRDDYQAGCDAFAARMTELTQRLLAEMAPWRGTPVVTYHRAWPYFLERFGLVRINEVEPKPGIAPGPQHVSEVVESMERSGAKVIIMETFSPARTAESIAERAGGRAVILALEVNGVPQAESYQKLFEYNVGTLLKAFHELGVTPREPA